MKDRIQDTVLECINNFERNVGDNIMLDCVEDGKPSFAGWNSNYHPESDIYKLLFDIGVILENDTLINMFKKPKTIDQIIEEANEANICEFEELEEIEEIGSSNKDPETIYVFTIFKHKPTNKFYSFCVQKAMDGTRIVLEFDREVEKREIIKTVWEAK